MTTEQYENIAMPTEADFRSWTRWLFAKWDRLEERVKALYPEMFAMKVTELDELPIFAKGGVM